MHNPRRSQLYVPANDERKIAKSNSLSADSLIFDLEDAVPSSEKQRARESLRSLLERTEFSTSTELCVRINKVTSDDYSNEDILAISKISKVNAIVLPKTEQISVDLSKRIGLPIIALIETARGLLNVERISSSPNVSAVSFGPQDFANSVVGNVEAYRENTYIKTHILVTAKASGIDAIDGVFFKLNDLDGFRAEAIGSRNLGYIGKQVVHPTQVKIANEVYSVSEKEIEEARQIVEQYEKAQIEGSGAFRLNDALVDAVHYRRAKELLERAQRKV